MRNESRNDQTFDSRSLEFEFLAVDRFVFPHILSANSFRGALGLTLSRMAPDVYATIFAPTGTPASRSGFLNPPRPFVFRTRHLDGMAVEPGLTFTVRMNVFGRIARNHLSLLSTLTEAFAEMGRAGFGPQRSRAKLHRGSATAELSSFPIAPQQNVRSLRLDFLTPTEIKSEDRLVEEPLFPALSRRARDRISTLMMLYGPEPLEIDFEGLGARADAVELVRSSVHHVQAARRSSRTGQTHPLGGFTGCAEYAGNLSEFVPYLQIATHTGIGRQTVWGKGEIATRILS